MDSALDVSGHVQLNSDYLGIPTVFLPAEVDLKDFMYEMLFGSRLFAKFLYLLVSDLLVAHRSS